MVKRQTWILLIVFTVLVGVALLWTGLQTNWKKSHPTTTPTPEQYLFTMDFNAVSSLEITNNTSGKTVRMKRDDAGQWALVDPQAEYTDVAAVGNAVKQLASLQVTSSLPTTDNLAEYGLDQPEYTITVTVNEKGQLIAQVGSATVTSNGYYVLVPGDVPKIVSKNSLDAVLKLWKNPPIATPTIAPTQTGEITPAVVTTATLTSTPQPVLTDTPAPPVTATVPPATATRELQATETLQVATPTETVKP